LISPVILSFQRKGGSGGPPPPQCLHFWSSRTAFLAFSKANSKTINISTNNKQNTFPLDYFHVQDPSAVRNYINRLSFHWTVCEFVVGDNPWTINLNNSTHICSQSDVSDYNSNTKWSGLFSVFNNCSNLQVDRAVTV
jgi:hypothetical protein